MLFSAALIEAVAGALEDRALPLVVDPVMVASSGSRLLLPDAVGTLVARLFPLATVVTPNLPEAQALTALATEDRRVLAERLVAMGAGGPGHRGPRGRAGGPPLRRIAAPGHPGGPSRRGRDARRRAATDSAALAAGLAAGLPLAEAACQAAAVAGEAVAHGLAGLGAGEGPSTSCTGTDLRQYRSTTGRQPGERQLQR